MRVFRIEREKFLGTALAGVGASLSSGARWNSLHTRMVYTAGSRSLAILEIAVHLDLSEDLPNDRYMVEIDIPDFVPKEQLFMESLPLFWDAKPPGKASRQVGDQFVSRGESLVLQVPSVIVPQEYNFLLNPLHPAMREITVVDAVPLVLDGRLAR